MATLRAATRAHMGIVVRLPPHNISLLPLLEDIMRRVPSITNRVVSKASTGLVLNSTSAAHHNMDRHLALIRASTISTAIRKPLRLDILHRRSLIMDRVVVHHRMPRASNISHLSLMEHQVNNITTINSTLPHLHLILLANHTVRINNIPIRIKVKQVNSMAIMGTILRRLRVHILVRRGHPVIITSWASPADRGRGRGRDMGE